MLYRGAALVCSVVAVAPALAQPGSDVERLFEEGRTLAKQGRWAEACDRFARSYQLDRALGTQLNLADCQEKLGRLREAWQLFLSAEKEAERTGDDKRSQFARERAAALVPKLGSLVVKVAEPERAGLVITIGSRAVPVEAEIRDQVDPGDIEVVATVPGHAPVTTIARTVAGSVVVVEIPAFGASAASGADPQVTLTPRTVDGARPVEPPSELFERPQPNRTRAYLAYGIGGVGVISGVTAVVLTLKARGDYRSTAEGPLCEQASNGLRCELAGHTQIDSAQRLADIGTGFAIGGGLLVATAAILYVTAPSTRLSVAPTASATSVGFAATHRF